MTYIDRFKEWQNYAHYLAGAFMLWLFLGITHHFWLGFKDFLWFLLAFFIIDTIVHTVFWFAKPPIRWRS